jgi:integrase/recombinase XerD
VTGSTDAFVRYLTTERGLSPATAKIYVREIDALASHIGRRINKPRPEDVRSFISATGGSASTITRRLAAIRTYYRFRRLPDPTVEISRPKRRRGIPRPVEDLDERLAGADGLTKALAILLVETGLRISEATAIKVDLPPPEELHIRGKGDRDRIIPLTARARRALSALGGRVPFQARAAQRRLAEFGIHPHALRHTFATRLAQSGADLGEIQDLLGHASPATSRVYTAYSTERLRKAVERMSRQRRPVGSAP